mmetsp:Transcript_17326/g.25235  ORF Transcript_17326/g.25235 Transcript_17326/m.25235 type:complete len:194 (+) Transcript_17326:810-1391(+)
MQANRNLRILPDGVTFQEDPLLGCRFTTAYRAIVQQGLGLDSQQGHMRQMEQTQNKTVCVFGCGGLGLSCIMIAKAFQVEGNINSIIVVDVSSQALAKALELGADQIVNAKLLAVNAKDGNEDDLVRKRVVELTEGLGAELTIDAAGFASTCKNTVHCTRRGGRMWSKLACQSEGAGTPRYQWVRLPVENLKL